MGEPYVAIIIVNYGEQTGCDHVIVEVTLESGNETNISIKLKFTSYLIP